MKYNSNIMFFFVLQIIQLIQYNYIVPDDLYSPLVNYVNHKMLLNQNESYLVLEAKQVL